MSADVLHVSAESSLQCKSSYVHHLKEIHRYHTLGHWSATQYNGGLPSTSKGTKGTGDLTVWGLPKCSWTTSASAPKMYLRPLRGQDGQRILRRCSA